MRVVQSTVYAVAALASCAVTARAAPSSVDQRFIEQAMASDGNEIAASRLAEDHGSPAIRLFGRWMVVDHTLVSTLLAERVRAIGSAAADTPAPADGSGLATLHDKQFDERYLQLQLAGHQKAVALFGDEAEHGQDPGLKQLAEDVLPSLREHLAAVQDLQARPLAQPPTQTSLPSSAPPATTSQNTAATTQTPKVQQMNAEEKQKLETGGK